MSQQSNTPPAEPVTLAQAKAWLHVESGDDEDALIADLIATARMRAEAHTGRVFSGDVAAPRHGFVYGDPMPAKQPGLYRYTIQGPIPNSGGRDIKVVLIPSMHKACAKILTVMWADEVTARG